MLRGFCPRIPLRYFHQDYFTNSSHDSFKDSFIDFPGIYYGILSGVPLKIYLMNSMGISPVSYQGIFRHFSRNSFINFPGFLLGIYPCILRGSFPDFLIIPSGTLSGTFPRIRRLRNFSRDFNRDSYIYFTRGSFGSFFMVLQRSLLLLF